ncbi:hypothetical protein N0V82_008530 [Gnomoniopsis sp. IMI 355080]|nr:hypothetical protein N0V82_008530 [Gnomoniopsis sp. IMI 355080]
MALIMAILGAIVLVGCLQLLRTKRRPHLRYIPGPVVASFSNFWRVAAVYFEDMPGWAAQVHRKYGRVSSFYEVGAPFYGGGPMENMFSLRDIEQHASLRRRIGCLFANTSVKDLESNVDLSVNYFLRWLAEQTKDGVATIDMAKWMHFYAYDCLSQINVSKSLGFMEIGDDVKDKNGLGYIEAAGTIFYMVGLFTLKEVEARIASPQKQKDMLDKLMTLHQEQPDKVSLREVTSAIWINLYVTRCPTSAPKETQLLINFSSAGHDALATTLRALFYYLAQNPATAKKLQDEILSAAAGFDDSRVVPDLVVSKLPYLEAVIQETLRFHPVTGEILERQVTDGGAVIDGYYTPGGAIVGVNAWVLHFNKDIFGQDADQFCPERWLNSSEEQKQEMKRFVFAFGAGSRSCIGKHIALMMSKKLVFEFYRRYEATLKYPERKWKVHGSWVATQTDMDMIVRGL